MATAFRRYLLPPSSELTVLHTFRTKSIHFCRPHVPNMSFPSDQPRFYQHLENSTNAAPLDMHLPVFSYKGIILRLAYTKKGNSPYVAASHGISATCCVQGALAAIFGRHAPKRPGRTPASLPGKALGIAGTYAGGGAVRTAPELRSRLSTRGLLHDEICLRVQRAQSLHWHTPLHVRVTGDLPVTIRYICVSQVTEWSYTTTQACHC